MLEQISLSISTAIFLLCAMIANSVLPKSQPAEQIPPISDNLPALSVSVTDEFSIVGKWNSDGRIFEFTDSGKFIFNNMSAKYSLKPEAVVIETVMSKEKRQYELPLTVLSDKVISLNGIHLYRVE